MQFGPLSIEVDGLTDMAGGAFALPSGTVTFLLTDVAGSTAMWQAYPDSMPVAIARHYQLLDEAIARHGGVRPLEQGEGDSVVGAFARASDAIAAALDGQRCFVAEAWPEGVRLAVRMAIHTGEAVQRDHGNYVGTAIIRAARIRSAGHGGQILVSEAAAAVAADRLPPGAVLVDLGAHRLKDLARPERIWALHHPDLLTVDEPLRSLDLFRHNLPAQATPLIGRRDELRAVAAELQRERLVTLTGAGGVGKTRLAVQVGAELVDRFPAGVWWLELGPVADPGAIAPALLAAMGVSEDGLRPATAVAVDHLARGGAALVVFDNCEHLVAAVAELIESLQSSCPDLTVLATSREPLGLPGEVTWRVPSLTVPPPGTATDIASLSRYESVRLFLERAHRARPRLQLSDSQAAAVAEICHRLDGIPLAIELAAARCRQLSPERIAVELTDRFRLLTGGARTLLPRQQTLQASVEWSHDRLSDDERTVLRRLAVFAGPFRCDAAEAVVSSVGDLDRWLVLDALTRLVDKSLVQLDESSDAETPPDEPLYRLLETVRQFAIDHARRAGELSVLRDAHADWWIEELERLDARQPSNAIVDLCDRHIADLRSALDWLDDDLARRYRLLALVGLAWSWAGRTDDLLAYADRWLLGGPIAGCETAWALAYAPCSWAIYCTRLEFFRRHQGAVYELIEASGDGRAAMAAFVILLTDDEAKGPRAERGLTLAHRSGAFSLLRAVGPLLLIFVDAHDPSYSARARELLFEATTGADSPHQVWSPLIPYLRAHPNISGVQGLLPGAGDWDPTVHSFLLDRLMYAVMAAIITLRTGDLELLDKVINFLGAFRHLFAPRLWWRGAEAIATLLRGGTLSTADANALRWFDVDGPHVYRYMCVRALLSQDHLTPAVELLGEIDHPTVPATQFSCALGRAAMALHEGEVITAGEHLGVALELAVDLPWPEYQVDLLELMAVVATRHGDGDRAGRLVGAADTIRRTVGMRYRFSDQQAWIEEAREATATTWDAAFAEGTGLTAEDAIAYARRSRGRRQRPTAGWDSLTPTELDVATLVADGLTNQQIAERMLIGVATVKTHVSHALGKLGLSTRTELASTVVRHQARAEPGRVTTT